MTHAVAGAGSAGAGRADLFVTQDPPSRVGGAVPLRMR